MIMSSMNNDTIIILLITYYKKSDFFSLIENRVHQVQSAMLEFFQSFLLDISLKKKKNKQTNKHVRHFA